MLINEPLHLIHTCSNWYSTNGNITIQSLFPLSGQVGEWKSWFTADMDEDFNRVINEWNKDRQIPFIYEIWNDINKLISFDIWTSGMTLGHALTRSGRVVFMLLVCPRVFRYSYSDIYFAMLKIGSMINLFASKHLSWDVAKLAEVWHWGIVGVFSCQLFYLPLLVPQACCKLNVWRPCFPLFDILCQFWRSKAFCSYGLVCEALVPFPV